MTNTDDNNEHAKNQSRKGRSRTIPIKAGGLKFAIDKFNQDCLPNQFLREATENSIEAIPDGGVGKVKWTYDPIWRNKNGSHKLCIIDNGIGMTGREIKKYINTMWESGKGVGHGMNFGMGVKISSITNNPLGIEYYSWKDGIGYFATLWYDDEIDDYGLKLLEDENGGWVEWLEEIDNRFMPSIIENNQGNGTKLVFLGNSEEEDTFVNQEAPYPSRWISYNLNNRYYRIPDNISIQARRLENGKKPSNTLRVVRGIEYLLSRHGAEETGTINLNDGMLHWMLLKDAKERHPYTDFDSGAQSAVLFDDELYHKKNRMGHRSRMASKFGLLFSHNRVAVFIEPEIEGLDTDMVRKNLVMPNNQENLPWRRWGEAFKENMPDPIRELESALNDKAQRGNDLELNNRIAKFLKENQMPQFESNKLGDLEIDSPDSKSHKEGISGNEKEELPDNSGNKSKEKDYSYYLKPKSKRKAKERLRKSPPIAVRWIQEEDGTRDQEFLTDMACEMDHENRLLIINRDYRGWKGLVKEVVSVTSDTDPVRDENIVLRCELEYAWDFCLSVLKGYKHNDNVNWNRDSIESKMLSPEALTGASLSNKYLISYLNGNMGKWLTKRREEDLIA